MLARIQGFTYVGGPAFLACNRTVAMPVVWCGGQALVDAMVNTAAFLREQGLILSVLPSGAHLAQQDLVEAYATAVNDLPIRQSMLLNTTLAHLVLHVGAEVPASDSVPSHADAVPSPACNSSSVYPVGLGASAESPSSNGSLTDGAGGIDGQLYAANLLCRWSITAATSDGIVLVSFPVSRIRLGDSLEVYQGKSSNGKLLASIAGPALPHPPPLSTHGRMTLEFRTDSFLHTLPYNKPWGDGF
eukprot:6731698-Prymnesium_polylepis.1